MPIPFRARFVLLGFLILPFLPAPAGAQMVAGPKIPGFADTFGVQLDQRSYPYTAHLAASSIPGNILWPDDAVTFSFQLVNNTDQPIETRGKVDVIAYATRGHPGDVWVPDMYKIADGVSEPIDVKLPAKGFADFKISPKIPAKFGAYALVVDLGPAGRQFLTSCVRTFAADSKRVQYPRFCLDDFSIDALKRLGVKAVRHGVGYKPTTDPDYEVWYQKEAAKLKELNDANIAVLFMAGGGGFYGPTQPLSRPRPWLDDDAVMKETKFDLAWVPSYDDDFQKWIARFATEYGWPKGPINAFSLWNEPWEGISISGWGADMLRYRAIFTHMALGVEEARKQGAQVLIGGCDSTSNALDKMFGDGSDQFLKWFDFVSIHYQGMSPASTIKMWVDRKSPNGRVRIWDTESWVANTDDRVAAVVATNRAAGYDRAMGIFAGVIGEEQDQTILVEKGKPQRVKVPLAWSVAAAVGASQHFLGERAFRELLFKNGLPWVMVFDGEPDDQGKPKADDGTVVVVGDIGEEFGHDQVLFRTVHGLANIPMIAEAQRKIAALPADAPKKDRAEALAELEHALTLTGATMTLDAAGGKFGLFDFYGNPVEAKDGKIVIPLDSRGFFLRADGSPGSFDALLEALRHAWTEGIEPIAPVAHDMTARIEQHPKLRLSLTNILNRPTHAMLNAKLGDLQLEPASQLLDFDANQTREVEITIAGGASIPSNTYPLSLTIDAGPDGKTEHHEDMHCNVIAKRTITVDGDLQDWKDVLPQTVTGGNGAPSLTEAAWFPFKKFDDSARSGLATGYMAYDDNNFYFAAKVADDTPDEGMPRFEKRDEDEAFYPPVSYQVDPKKTLEHREVVLTESSHDTSALQKPGSKESRIEAGWVTTVKSFAIDLKLPEGQPKQVAFYFLNPREGGAALVDVSDQASGKSLARHVVEKYHDGRYAVFNLAGNVRVMISTNGGQPAVLCGIFFDPLKPNPKARHSGKSAPTSAAFVTMDDQTQGNWQGAYGADGYLVVGTPASYPAYAQVNVPTMSEKETLTWPEGVRRYSYRKNPELPAGNGLQNHDNVQIAFNVLPPDQKDWYPCPPGTMPGFTTYRDTDYEYALNPVAARFGGGTEIWRLLRPGMPRKHFYPRQGKSPDDGPVKDGKLVIVRDGNMRLVECAIPWTEIPAVKARLDAGQTIKFSFRVNDNANVGCMELSRDRSVAKRNQSFHCDWVEHWANEVEFGFEK